MNTLEGHTSVPPVFPKPIDVGERPWGREILLVLIPGVLSLKRLEINAGFKGGLQRHHKKNECGYILSGTLMFRYDPGNGVLLERTLRKGEALHIPPGCVHQEEALTDVVIIEASTPHFNDRVRMEPAYGMQIPEGGLPSTTPEEVELR
ncbi:MAG: cupin protein [Candidatus Adlerbacteria bacterium]|nr:cupin protein [Candidatus Adlerbacteria bacterium]